MTTTAKSDASTFRVVKSIFDEHGYFVIVSKGNWLMKDGTVFHPNEHGYFPTEAEAIFRLALYQDRSAVLSAWGFSEDTPLAVVADWLEDDWRGEILRGIVE